MTEPIRQPFINPMGLTGRLTRHKAVTGLKARVRWWERIVSLVSLLILVGIIGLLLALIDPISFEFYATALHSAPWVIVCEFILFSIIVDIISAISEE